MPGTLEGIKVIEWGMFINGVATGYILGDMGAQVIKLEQPVTGDAARGLVRLYGAGMDLPGGRVITFETANRNKRSITLNLKHEKGREIAYRLIKAADVFITNFNDSVAQSCGVDWDTLSKLNPRLVYGVASGFGSKGPRAKQRAFDNIAQAASGLMFAAGDKSSNEPATFVGAILDTGSSTILGMGILAALVRREKTGKGQRVDTSLLGTAMHFQALNVNTVLWRGRPMSRHSHKQAPNPLGNHYACADGKWLLFAEPQSQRFWPEFCKAIGRPELEKDSRFDTIEKRIANQELIRLLEEVFKTRTRDQWIESFKGCSFSHTAITSLEEATTDADVIANRYVVDWDHPALGKVKTVGFPVEYSESPCALQGPAPHMGEHTEEILLEMGFTWEQIGELRDSGAI